MPETCPFLNKCWMKTPNCNGQNVVCTLLGTSQYFGICIMCGKKIIVRYINDSSAICESCDRPGGFVQEREKLFSAQPK
jgi:hypothetical protein